MRVRRLIPVFVLCISVCLAVQAGAAVDIGLSIDEEGLRGFYLAVGDYFRVPEREVILVRERRIPDEEIPVVFFLASSARVEPEVILDLRLKGMTWMDITLRYGLTPEVFYIPVKHHPRGKAYGYYLNKPKKEWKRLVLRDADVVNLVNLSFVNEYYRHPTGEIIKLREGGKNFVVISDDLRKKRGGRAPRSAGSGEPSGKFKEEKGHGKEQGKEKQEKHEGKGKGKHK